MLGNGCATSWWLGETVAGSEAFCSSRTWQATGSSVIKCSHMIEKILRLCRCLKTLCGIIYLTLAGSDVILFYLATRRPSNHKLIT